MDRKVIDLSHSFSLFCSLSLITYLPTYRSIYLSTYLSSCLSIYLPTYLSSCLSIYLSTYLPTYLSIYLSISRFFLSVNLPTCLSATLKTELFCETSSLFKVDNIKNAAILRDFLIVLKVDNIKNAAILHDFLIFQTWQHQKRNNSAWLPDFSKLRTSKTKQFCENSSIFEFDNIKNKAILRDFLQKWKVECRADSLVPMRFTIFPLHLSKVLRVPQKIDARSYEVLHLSRKIILANLQIWCSKRQPLSGNQRPDLLTSLMNMSCVLCLPREMHLWRSSSNVPRLPSFLEMPQRPHVLLTFDKVHNPLRLPRKSTLQRPKVARTCGALCILTSKCASRHNGVHFFDILTSKSGPDLVCFVHFDFEMCFAAQRRALFRHLNFQKWSGPGVLCAFWLRNVLRATTACNFSSLIWPDGFAPAALASLLFDPPEPQIIGKHSVSRLSYLFAHLHLLSSDSFSSLIFSLLLLFSDLLSSTLLFSLTLPISTFHLPILSEVWLLNFLRLLLCLTCQGV